MIVLYKGARGRGKTLTMVRDAFNYRANGWKIYSNMESIGFAEYINNRNILKINKDSELYNCVLIIDEIQSLFDSRRSMAKGNLDFSYFLQQIRKRGIILLCTAQYSNTVDIRLRQHVDVIAIPRFVKEFNICEVAYMDLTSIEDDEYGVTEPKSIEITFECQNIFGLYDTKEIIT